MPGCGRKFFSEPAYWLLVLVLLIMWLVWVVHAWASTTLFLCTLWSEKFWKQGKIAYICNPFRCDGRAVRHRSAKPGTAVRFRFAPPKMPLQIAVGAFAFQKLATFWPHSISWLHGIWKRWSSPAPCVIPIHPFRCFVNETYIIRWDYYFPSAESSTW